jgi:PAS domain S-box-containing protein
VHCAWSAATARLEPRQERTLRAFIEMARDSEKSRSIEIKVIPDDGEPRYALLRARGCRGADGQRRVLGVLLDDSERARVNRNNEAKFRAVAHGVPNFLLFLNRDLRVEFCNDHFLKNTQWTREAAQGRHISEILGPQRYAERRAYYERALAGETFTFESTGAVGNEAGYFRFYYQPSFDDQGNVHGVFSTATDISERRAAEIALEDKQAELTRSNEDLEQFAYVASHDLRAPLRAVNSLAQWIEEDLGARLDPDNRGRLRLMRERVMRMDQLIKGLLAYARLGRVPQVLTTVELLPLVRSVVDELAPGAGVQVHLEGTFPVLRADPIHLRQVFQNLIVNAIEHHDRPNGTVWIRSRNEGDLWHLEVADDGPGIPASARSKVFNLFSGARGGDHTGIGLAVVKKLVSSYGGTVDVTENVPRGALFRIAWPA